MTPTTPRLKAARRRRQRWARAFRPAEVDLLLIAEAPPRDLDRYFYFPNVYSHDSLFLEVSTAILRRAVRRQDKSEVLAELSKRGVFLIDAHPEPLAGKLRIATGRLISRIRRLRPKRIVLIKAPVFDQSYWSLKEVGLPVVNVRVPFPGSGQQLVFREAFRRAMRARPKDRSDG